jgi:hypothetical protein
MYVSKYDNTIQGELMKSLRSCDIVTREVATMEVSRLENRRPRRSLIGISKQHEAEKAMI